MRRNRNGFLTNGIFDYICRNKFFEPALIIGDRSQETLIFKVASVDLFYGSFFFIAFNKCRVYNNFKERKNRSEPTNAEPIAGMVTE